MNQKVTIFVLTLIVLHVSSKSFGQLININLSNAFKTKKQIKLSDIAYLVEYVKLESNPNCRVEPQDRVYCNNKYINTISINTIFVFDRKTGAFITKIGKSDHIYSTYYFIPFDEKRNIITYKSTPNTIAEFSTINNFLQDVQLPVTHGNSVHWKNSSYIQFVANISGNDTMRLIMFTEDNTVIKIHPNKNRFVKNAKANYYSNKKGGFYWVNQNLYFKETFIDTIYQITEEKLIPKYCFDEGYRGLNYSMKGTLDFRNKQNFFFISNIYETEKYLLFIIDYRLKVYSGVFFKNENSCKISYCCLINRIGFINDIDDFMPLHFSSVNNSNELVGFCIPEEIEKWKKENTAKIPDEERLRMLWVHKDDIPVVIIAKLK